MNFSTEYMRDTSSRQSGDMAVLLTDTQDVGQNDTVKQVATKPRQLGTWDDAPV